MTKQGILDAAKHLSIKENVSIQVLDRLTGQVVQEHTGHNQATNSLLFGIAHHLIGDFVPNERHGLNPGFSMLSNYVPRYISLGTMGLINQEQDSRGLPAGIGDNIIGASDDPTYRRLLEEVEEAEAELAAAEEALKNECPYYPATEACKTCQECSTRINDKKQAREDAKQAYADALDALMTYSEESRFVDYMKHTPGYSADGYNKDSSKNNNRKYFGLGYPYTSYYVTAHYKAETTNHEADKVTYRGILYKCNADTPVPAGQFNPEYWEALPDSEQPFDGKTINMELISNVYPRMDISYRDVVPEGKSELRDTIDIVYSAMISTGALAQFREEGKDYVFITEAGLWSKRTWSDTNENGLLAGYRIVPPNKENWDMTVPENRKILKENILKVGTNQVVQVVWKIQIGSVSDLVNKVVYPHNDNIYYAISTPSTEYANPLNQLLSEKIANKSEPVAFEKSKFKRGVQVPYSIFATQEPLYLEFTMDENKQIIYWWSPTGEVRYSDLYVDDMFDGLNITTADLTGWYEYVRYMELEDGGRLLLEDDGFLLL